MLSPQMSFTIIVLYRPPSSDGSFCEKFEKLLKECNLNKDTVISGDFNINWEETSCRKNLKRIMDKFDFVQMIKGPRESLHQAAPRLIWYLQTDQ